MAELTNRLLVFREDSHVLVVANIIEHYFAELAYRAEIEADALTAQLFRAGYRRTQVLDEDDGCCGIWQYKENVRATWK